MTMASLRTEYICTCFLKRNIFLKKYRMHVSFENDAQFKEEYRQLLRLKGCATENQYKEVQNEIQLEIKRRKSFHELSHANFIYNQHNYIKLHPTLWRLEPSFIDKRFLNIVKSAEQMSQDALLMTLVENEGYITESEVYRFPVFTKEFCNQLNEEIKNFELFPGPKSRPNTMNAYGISLDEMGLSNGLIMPLIRDYLQQVTKGLFLKWGGGSFDSFKAFVVNYDVEGDKDLALHYDNAEVTININLDSDYEGGLLQFQGIWGEQDTQKKILCGHEIGHGILHCGRHLHSALPLTSGKRCNLVIWMRSSAVRNRLCPMCGKTPTLLPVPFAGEGFTLDQAQSWSCTCS